MKAPPGGSGGAERTEAGRSVLAAYRALEAQVLDGARGEALDAPLSSPDPAGGISH